MSDSKGFWRRTLGPNTGPTPQPFKGYRSTENVHDDSIWGTEWTQQRYAEAEKLRQKQAAEARQKREVRERVTHDRKAAEKKAAENPEAAFQWARFEGSGQKYHITPSGEARPCQATTRACPYGSEDHFSMGPASGVDPQRAAEWIIERRTLGHDSTLKFEVPRHGAENPRALARQAQADAARRGARANIIEVEATIHLNDSMRPIVVSRRIGNTYNNRLADHAYWVLEDGHESHRVVTDSMSEADLQQFLDRYISTMNVMLPEDEKELHDELSAQIRNIMAVAEGEAAQAPVGSSHHTTVQLGLDGLPELNEQGEFQGEVNYGSTGFEPHHLKGALLRHKNINQVRFAEGFEVFDNDAGEGTAGWRLVKGSEGWDLTVIGTRGDEHLFHPASAEEAGALMEEAYGRHVSQRNERKGRYFGDASAPEGVTEAKANRVSFIRNLLRLEKSK